MDKDADAGYDALVLNLDAHVAVAALARARGARRVRKAASRASRRSAADARPRRGVAELLRSRLRAVAAPNVRRKHRARNDRERRRAVEARGEPAAQPDTVLHPWPGHGTPAGVPAPQPC